MKSGSGQRERLIAALEKRRRPLAALNRNAALSFVIPSEAEGSAVQRISPGNVFGDVGRLKRGDRGTDEP
jgi:hypothetical protein